MIVDRKWMTHKYIYYQIEWSDICMKFKIMKEIERSVHDAWTWWNNIMRCALFQCIHWLVLILPFHFFPPCNKGISNTHFCFCPLKFPHFIVVEGVWFFFWNNLLFFLSLKWKSTTIWIGAHECVYVRERQSNDEHPF